MINPLINTDSYKASHWLQYEPGTQETFFYFGPRGRRATLEESKKQDDITTHNYVVFGLQAFLSEYLNNPIRYEHIVEAERFITKHGEPFNRAGWTQIHRKYGGYIPMRIRALKEGSVVPMGVPCMIVESVDGFFWIPSYWETQLVRMWYPITVATISRKAKEIIMDCLRVTSDDPDGQIGFKLHDFGARGVSSLESSAIGGAAHLVNFMGSDTMAGVHYANKYYGHLGEMLGYSIPAAEHSTITCYGEKNEAEAYRNMLRNFAKPGSLVAVVSDSYNIYNAVQNIWGKELKEEVINSGATVIIRPDSGNPEVVVMKTLWALNEAYGSTVNSKGYKVLNNVRVIQGDGIGLEVIRNICYALMNEKFSLDNIAFGMGGGLLQKCNRDTLKFAMKLSAVKVDGEWKDVYKKPVGDISKASIPGKFKVVVGGDGYEVAKPDDPRPDAMDVVYETGIVKRFQYMEDIRKLAAV